MRNVMHNYLNFKPRLNKTPRVKTPAVSKVYFAWCYQVKDGWEEGENFIHPNPPAISIEDLEEDRASKFDLDYQKEYYKDHYLMLVAKYYKKDVEYTIFLMPEHAYELFVIGHGTGGSSHPPTQPHYSWEQLNLEETWDEYNLEGENNEEGS
jgi:hypothetical protein